MARAFQLATVFAVFALTAAAAQQPESPPKPAGPRSPTYPTPAPVANPPAPAPQDGVIGPAPNFTGNTGTLDPAGYTVGRRVFEAGGRNATWHMHTAARGGGDGGVSGEK